MQLDDYFPYLVSLNTIYTIFLQLTFQEQKIVSCRIQGILIFASLVEVCPAVSLVTCPK